MSDVRSARGGGRRAERSRCMAENRSIEPSGRYGIWNICPGGTSRGLAVARRKQRHLPRGPREPTRESVTAGASRGSRRRRRAEIAAGGILAVIAVVVGLSVLGRNDSVADAERQVEREVGQLLTGIPQHRRTLGSADAPVTLQVFVDLKDPDSRSWFLTELPAIVRDYVHPGTLKLEFRSYKTNTFSPEEFVKGQTAALAAGAQNRLWNFIDTFYYEQGSELRRYVTDAYLQNLARQVSGLDIAEWRTDRQTGRREEQTTSEDQAARAIGLHVTPSFRIGRTGGRLTDFSGHAVIKYGEQHPIALPTSQDIGNAIKALITHR